MFRKVASAAFVVCTMMLPSAGFAAGHDGGHSRGGGRSGGGEHFNSSRGGRSYVRPGRPYVGRGYPGSYGGYGYRGGIALGFGSGYGYGGYPYGYSYDPGYAVAVPPPPPPCGQPVYDRYGNPIQDPRCYSNPQQYPPQQLQYGQPRQYDPNQQSQPYYGR